MLLACPHADPERPPCHASPQQRDSQLALEDSASGSSPPVSLCRPSHPLSWGLFELFTHLTVSLCRNYNCKTLW